MTLPRRILLAMALACVTAVGLAVYAQQAYDMRPCPWCVLQRVIYLAIAVVALLGALLPLRVPAAWLALLFALGGAAAAAYQHWVAARSTSCKLTLADKIVSGLGLDTLLPSWFQVTASCAEAIVDVLGVPFDIWSLTMFALLVVGAALALRGKP